MTRETIKEFDNFVLQYVTGVGVNDTPYEEIDILSRGLAEKHVVSIRTSSGVYKFEGEPVKRLVTGVDVSHGMRMHADTLAETQEYIRVLQEALDVAFEVQKWCILNGWWKE